MHPHIPTPTFPTSPVPPAEHRYGTAVTVRPGRSSLPRRRHLPPGTARPGPLPRPGGGTTPWPGTRATRTSATVATAAARK